MTFTKPTAHGWGEAIRETRTELGLSLLEVAKRTGIDPGHLSRAERGLAGIGEDYRAAIAKALGKPPTYFTDTTSKDAPCPSADSAADAAPSPTPATQEARRSPAPSVAAPVPSAPAANRSTEVA